MKTGRRAEFEGSIPSWGVKCRRDAELPTLVLHAHCSVTFHILKDRMTDTALDPTQ